MAFPGAVAFVMFRPLQEETFLKISCRTPLLGVCYAQGRAPFGRRLTSRFPLDRSRPGGQRLCLRTGRVSTHDRRFAGLLCSRSGHYVAARLRPGALRAAARAAAGRAGSGRPSLGATARNQTRPNAGRPRPTPPNRSGGHALSGSTRRERAASRGRLRLDRDPSAHARTRRHFVSNGSVECGCFPDHLSDADRGSGPYTPN
jgi:hypothetical protein